MRPLILDAGAGCASPTPKTLAAACLTRRPCFAAACSPAASAGRSHWLRDGENRAARRAGVQGRRMMLRTFLRGLRGADVSASPERSHGVELEQELHQVQDARRQSAKSLLAVISSNAEQCKLAASSDYAVAFDNERLRLRRELDGWSDELVWEELDRAFEDFETSLDMSQSHKSGIASFDSPEDFPLSLKLALADAGTLSFIASTSALAAADVLKARKCL